MPHPFEVEVEYLRAHLEEMVDITFGDIQSQFLVMPMGSNFVPFPAFQQAYEILKQETSAFANFTETTVWKALQRDDLVLLVLRTVFGVSPPEWAEIAKAERNVDVPQNVARQLDTRCRAHRRYFQRPLTELASGRVQALVSVAVEYIVKGAPPGASDTVHRLNKIDTSDGLVSLRHAATQHIPYAVLLYEEVLGPAVREPQRLSFGTGGRRHGERDRRTPCTRENYIPQDRPSRAGAGV